MRGGQLRQRAGFCLAGKAIALFSRSLHEQAHAPVEITVEKSLGKLFAFLRRGVKGGFVGQWTCLAQKGCCCRLIVSACCCHDSRRR